MRFLLAQGFPKGKLRFLPAKHETTIDRSRGYNSADLTERLKLKIVKNDGSK